MSNQYSPTLKLLEAPTMPDRIIKPAFVFLSPSEIPSGPILAVQLGVSMLLSWGTIGMAWIAGLPVSVQVFLWAMVADYLSGLYACGKDEGGFWAKFSWRVGVEGIFRKALIGLISLIMWKICGLIGPAAELLSGGITYLFAINEAASVVKNLRYGKFEIPPIVDDVLLRARQQFESRSGAQQPIVVEVRKEKEKP